MNGREERLHAAVGEFVTIDPDEHVAGVLRLIEGRR